MSKVQTFDYDAFMRESEILLAHLKKLEDGAISSLPQFTDDELVEVLADLPDLDRLRQIEDGLITTLATVEPPPIRRQKAFNFTNQD